MNLPDELTAGPGIIVRAFNALRSYCKSITLKAGYGLKIDADDSGGLIKLDSSVLPSNDRMLPPFPTEGDHLLGFVDGELKWVTVEDCP